MKTMRPLAVIAIALAPACNTVLAQGTILAPATTVASPTPAVAKAEAEKTWSLSASAYTYIVPDSREYVQPTLAADRGRLHLEARYNYESLDTASLWAGCNFSVGEKLALDVTPMVGVVMGDVYGLAPGYRVALRYGKLELSSEGEYMFDTRDSSASFFYNWSELAISPVEWLRVGAALQRTKLYRSPFDVQRGFLVGLAYKRVDFTTYVFNPDASTPTAVLAVGLSF